jgi:hypothetical protein
MTHNEILRRYPNASASFIRANLSDENAGKIAKLESNPCDAPLEKKEVQRRSRERFLVSIKSKRKRLIDEDNLCEKYLVDLLRYSRVIPDDSPDQCRVEVSQEKCRKGEPEEITIKVWTE